MNRFLNNDGIALVTSLMFTLISLTMVMALMYMITASTQVSAQFKRYKTALEASYGGTELVTKEVLPLLLQNYSTSQIASQFSGISFTNEASQACLQSKIENPTRRWLSGCSSTASPKQNPDFIFKLSASSGNPFVVFTKIVDTLQGNTDLSGLQLEGTGVAEGSSSITPQHYPYAYRLEIQSERENNPTAQANIEVLYAY